MAAHHRGAILFAGCCVVAVLMTASVAADNKQAFRHFEQSSYLQALWADTCSFPLTGENVVVLVSVEQEADEPKIQCGWKRTPVSVGDSGVTLTEGTTDLDARWFACGDDTSLPGLVWDAVRNPGSNLVHLGNGLSFDAREALVLVAKCHYWDDDYCSGTDRNPHCDSPNANRILSMAYAVFDPITGEILW